MADSGCPNCKGALLVYDKRHPAWKEVGELSDWECDDCNKEAGESGGQDQLFACKGFEHCDYGRCRACKEKAHAGNGAAATVTAGTATGSCDNCKGGLLPYNEAHPAWKEVGELFDWECDDCNKEAGASAEQDMLFACSNFEECDWGQCRGCLERGSSGPPAAAAAAARAGPAAAVEVVCNGCQGGLIPYERGHPAHSMVGDVDDWDCDLCGGGFTEVDQFYTCRGFDVCDWGVCQGCFSKPAQAVPPTDETEQSMKSKKEKKRQEEADERAEEELVLEQEKEGVAAEMVVAAAKAEQDRLAAETAAKRAEEKLAAKEVVAATVRAEAEAAAKRAEEKLAAIEVAAATVVRAEAETAAKMAEEKVAATEVAAATVRAEEETAAKMEAEGDDEDDDELILDFAEETHTATEDGRKEGSCENCKGGLLPYNEAHPAWKAVGELFDWECNDCNKKAGASAEQDMLFACSNFDECDWGQCRGCLERGSGGSGALAEAEAKPPPAFVATEPIIAQTFAKGEKPTENSWSMLDELMVDFAVVLLGASR